MVAACGGDDDGGGGGGGGTDSALPLHRGYVSIQSYDAMNVPNMPTVGGYASAGFFKSDGYCTTLETIGPCEVASCTTTTPTGATSAGTITMTGGLQPVTLAPSADKTYAQLMTMTKLFDGGETITFAATGADVPAFTTTLTMPGKATITAPAEPPANSPYLLVPRSQDFAVSWSGGGGSGLLQVALDSSSADERLFCRFSVSARAGTIPAAALAKLPAGMGGFAMASIAEGEHLSGGWVVDVSGYFNAVWPDSSIVSGPATFQ